MKAIDSLTDQLVRKGYIPSEDRDIYVYGFDITIYTVLSTTALLLIGFLLRQFVPTLILVFGFYTFQTIGGGYHANTHLRCFLTMVAGLLVGLSSVSIQDRHILLWILFGIGALLLLFVPLVVHPNKSYLEAKRKCLTIRSIVVTLSILVCVIVINITLESMMYSFAAVFLLSGISRVTGKAVYRRLTTARNPDL